LLVWKDGRVIVGSERRGWVQPYLFTWSVLRQRSSFSHQRGRWTRWAGGQALPSWVLLGVAPPPRVVT
jgi:hypothetical protein